MLLPPKKERLLEHDLRGIVAKMETAEHITEWYCQAISYASEYHLRHRLLPSLFTQTTASKPLLLLHRSVFHKMFVSVVRCDLSSKICTVRRPVSYHW